MSITNPLIFSLRKSLKLMPIFVNIHRNAASSSASKSTSSSAVTYTGKRRFRLPVETDAQKLVNYCCGANYFKDGEPIKLKEDHEYPDWIWKLRLDGPAPLDQLEPNTKDYWERLEFLAIRRQRRHMKSWGGRKMIVGDAERKVIELRLRRRFRAMACHEHDAGYEIVPHSEREDFWLMDKDRYRLNDSEEEFVPGEDKIENLEYNIKNKLKWRKNFEKIGRIGV